MKKYKNGKKIYFTQRSQRLLFLLPGLFEIKGQTRQTKSYKNGPKLVYYQRMAGRI
jgi:hypothetical protein